MSEGVSSYLKNANRDYLAIFLLIALAAAVRIYLYSVTSIISRDGVTFLSLAEYFYGGDFAEGLSHDYHPAYPMLIGALFYPLKDFQLAGQMISIVAGSLLVLPVFYLGKGLFNETIGFGAGVLVVFHPYLVRFSTDVLSDSLYILFFITGICIGWRALGKRKPLYFFLTGVSTALAYLTRPEGVGILVVLGFWALIIGTNGIRLPNKKDFACTVLLTLGFILVASPYLIYLKEETGHWTLTKKKDIKKLIGIEEQESGMIEIDFKQQNVKIFAEQKKYSFSNSSETGKPLMSNIFGVNSSDGFKKALKLFNKFMETFHPALLLLTLFSFCRIHRFAGSGKSQLYVLSFFLLYVPIIFFLLMNIGYASRRHILPLCVIGLFWAAFGIEVLFGFVIYQAKFS